jgi:hypothetical protein
LDPFQAEIAARSAKYAVCLVGQRRSDAGSCRASGDGLADQLAAAADDVEATGHTGVFA